MNISSTDTPYLLTINRSASLPTVDQLNALKVSGVVLEVCDYFDSVIHQKSLYPDNKQFLSHYRYLKLNDVPVGVYFHLRGRTPNEVETEINYVLAHIKEYSIDVGIWMALHCYAFNRISLNDSLIDKCKDKLIAAGYQNQIGLYCSKKQLNYFSWPMHSSDWLLWIQDELTGGIELASILAGGRVPDNFFKVVK